MVSRPAGNILIGNKRKSIDGRGVRATSSPLMTPRHSHTDRQYAPNYLARAKDGAKRATNRTVVLVWTSILLLGCLVEAQSASAAPSTVPTIRASGTQLYLNGSPYH